jgi:hypothetical protein
MEQMGGATVAVEATPDGRLNLPTGESIVAVAESSAFTKALVERFLIDTIAGYAPHERAVLLADPTHAVTWAHSARNVMLVAQDGPGTVELLRTTRNILRSRKRDLTRQPHLVILALEPFDAIARLPAPAISNASRYFNEIATHLHGAMHFVSAGRVGRAEQLIRALRPASWLAGNGSYTCLTQDRAAIDAAGRRGAFGALLQTGRTAAQSLTPISIRPVQAEEREAALQLAYRPKGELQQTLRLHENYVTPELAFRYAMASVVYGLLNAPSWRALHAYHGTQRTVAAMLKHLNLAPSQANKRSVDQAIHAFMQEEGTEPFLQE